MKAPNRLMGGIKKNSETVCGNHPNAPTPAPSPGESSQKKAKKHPLPPKPRHPSPTPNEIENPPTSVDLDGSTSEDDAPVRRQSSRQTKKQKRAQKHNETKEDHTILKEMKTPIPSTSGPLIREQEKIKRMYPRKFQPVVATGPIGAVVAETLSSPPQPKKKSKENSTKDKYNGATRKSTRVDKRGNENDKGEIAAPRVTRNSSRVMPKVESDYNEEDVIPSTEKQSEPITPNSNTPSVSNANVPTENGNCTKNLNIDPTIASLPCLSTPPFVEGAFVPPTPSPPNQIELILKEKRQRKLPKRLVSPDVADLPPVLFRIASSGVINIVSEDEGPPKLSPMMHSPQVSRSRKRPGKENQLHSVTGRKSLLESSVDGEAAKTNKNCDEDEDKTEDGGEPARKRVARTRTSSTGTGHHPKVLPKTHEAEEIKTRMGTRASSRKSNT